jgi:hypothetical protein
MAFATAAAGGQDAPRPELTVAYLGLSAGADFSFRWDGHGAHTRHVGVLNWRVPDAEAGTAGLGREFRSYCAEALVGVEAGRTYQFEVQPADGPAGFGLADTGEGKAAAGRRAVYLRELFGRWYDPDAWEDDPDAARAFQVAVWEITHEAEPADGSAARLDLFGGTFRADYPTPADAPGFVRTAQEYLGGLTGDDAPFRQNGATIGRQLVRLGGLPSTAAGGAVAQSQFGLASVGSAGAGGAAGPSGAGGGFVPPAGGFASLVGLGALGSGFGGLGGGFGGVPFGGAGAVPTGPITASPTAPPTTFLPSDLAPTVGPTDTVPPFTSLPPDIPGVTPPPFGGPTDTLPPLTGFPPETPSVTPPPLGGPSGGPVGGPSGGGPSSPGGGPAPAPTAPIPAPAGLVLGLIGAGVMLARRVVGRAKP